MASERFNALGISSTFLSSKPPTVYESTTGVTAVSDQSKRPDGRGGIWEEYYPLIQPVRQYHDHRNGRGSSSYFFHGMFSSDVVCAYRDAVASYLVTVFSMTILSVTGLIFCKEWGVADHSIIVFLFRCLWLVSPACGSFALRQSMFDFCWSELS